MTNNDTTPAKPIAIVTGASRGIGRAIATRLAADGIHVFLTARDADALAEAVAAIQADGGTAAFLAQDLREADAAASVVDAALQRFGHLDIVVNNAGATKRGSFLDLTDEDFHDGFALKYFGAVRLLRAAWPHLKQSRGAVINIVGVGGRTPGAEFTIGGSVNAALLSLTKALADQGTKDGIQVNAISPGAVRTDRLAKRIDTLAQQEGVSRAEAEHRMVTAMVTTRIGEPSDIAGFVAYLVSPAGRFFQGALIDLDGGQTKTI